MTSKKKSKSVENDGKKTIVKTSNKSKDGDINNNVVNVVVNVPSPKKTKRRQSKPRKPKIDPASVSRLEATVNKHKSLLDKAEKLKIKIPDELKISVDASAVKTTADVNALENTVRIKNDEIEKIISKYTSGAQGFDSMPNNYLGGIIGQPSGGTAPIIIRPTGSTGTIIGNETSGQQPSQPSNEPSQQPSGQEPSQPSSDNSSSNQANVYETALVDISTKKGPIPSDVLTDTDFENFLERLTGIRNLDIEELFDENNVLKNKANGATEADIKEASVYKTAYYLLEKEESDGTNHWGDSTTNDYLQFWNFVNAYTGNKRRVGWYSRKDNPNLSLEETIAERESMRKEYLLKLTNNSVLPQNNTAPPPREVFVGLFQKPFPTQSNLQNKNTFKRYLEETLQTTTPIGELMSTPNVTTDNVTAGASPADLVTAQYYNVIQHVLDKNIMIMPWDSMFQIVHRLAYEAVVDGTNQIFSEKYNKLVKQVPPPYHLDISTNGDYTQLRQDLVARFMAETRSDRNWLKIQVRRVSKSWGGQNVDNITILEDALPNNTPPHSNPSGNSTQPISPITGAYNKPFPTTSDFVTLSSFNEFIQRALNTRLTLDELTETTYMSNQQASPLDFYTILFYKTIENRIATIKYQAQQETTEDYILMFLALEFPSRYYYLFADPEALTPTQKENLKEEMAEDFWSSLSREGWLKQQIRRIHNLSPMETHLPEPEDKIEHYIMVKQQQQQQPPPPPPPQSSQPRPALPPPTGGSPDNIMDVPNITNPAGTASGKPPPTHGGHHSIPEHPVGTRGYGSNRRSSGYHAMPYYDAEVK